MQKDPKIVTAEQLSKIVPKLQRQGKKVVTTNGGFDLLHVGHVRFLKRGSKFGDVLIVALNSDASMKKRKGDKRPVITLKHRAEMIAALPFVTYVSSFSGKKPTKWLETIKPDVHFKDDSRPIERYQAEADAIKPKGVLKIIPYTRETSTTKIIEKVLAAYGVTPSKE